MAADELVIGVDIGTQSTKAALMSVRGRLLAQHAQGYGVEMPRPLWAQQPAQPWLQAVQQCIRSVVDAGRRAHGLADGQVRAVAISGLYGGSGIPVDAQLEPLHPCLIWMDRRAQPQVDWVRKHVDVAELQRITGNGVDSYYGFTKMMWLREHAPDVWQHSWKLLPPNAWVVAQLTGEVAIDHSSAGNIGGVYDLALRGWSLPMLEQLGIPARLMPERLVGSHEVVGTLRVSQAAALGLQAGTPIVAGGVDAAVATLAAGAVRPGRHVAMLGTSMCWGTVREGHAGSAGLITMPHVVGALDRVYTFGGALTAGAAEVWARQALWEGDAVPEPAALEQAAAALPAGSDGLLFLPYLMGERSPVWDARASAGFLGLGLRHRRTHLYRAVLEGVAFALQHNITAALAGNGGLDEELIAVGGAARSDLWMQIIADVTGRPVLTLAEDVEATQGAAMLAARGAGLIDEADMARGWVQPVLRATPDPKHRAAYAALYEQYVAAYPALAGVMHGLASLGSA
jgi:sugar (pentulose or hexulose) kinase